MTTRRRVLTVVFGAVLIVGLAGGRPGTAHADGGSSDLGTRGSGGSSTDPDQTAAVKAIKAGDFPTAIRLLEGVVARNGKDADAYNWLAYAMRRNGNPAGSIPIYEKALALNPKHRGAHEYIGEAYLALDNLPKAKEHLAQLNSLCFFPCEEYSDLKRAVETYEKNGGKAKPAAAR